MLDCSVSSRLVDLRTEEGEEELVLQISSDASSLHSIVLPLSSLAHNLLHQLSRSLDWSSTLYRRGELILSIALRYTPFARTRTTDRPDLCLVEPFRSPLAGTTSSLSSHPEKRITTFTTSSRESLSPPLSFALLALLRASTRPDLPPPPPFQRRLPQRAQPPRLGPNQMDHLVDSQTLPFSHPFDQEDARVGDPSSKSDGFAESGGRVDGFGFESGGRR